MPSFTIRRNHCQQASRAGIIQDPAARRLIFRQLDVDVCTRPIQIVHRGGSSLVLFQFSRAPHWAPGIFLRCRRRADTHPLALQEVATDHVRDPEARMISTGPARISGFVSTAPNCPAAGRDRTHRPRHGDPPLGARKQQLACENTLNGLVAVGEMGLNLRDIAPDQAMQRTPVGELGASSAEPSLSTDGIRHSSGAFDSAGCSGVGRAGRA